MFRFLHAADLHLDTPFTTVRSMPAAVAQVLREASLQAWDRLVDAAIERRVAFVVLAGDIYDGAERGLRAQLRFLHGLERLDDAGIRTFLVHGNHDPVKEGWVAIDHLPPLAHRFLAADESGPGVEAVTFDVGGERVTVHGISYAERETTENLALRFPRDPGPGFHLGLLHANIGGVEAHDPYSPGTLTDLRSRGIDYWALGHIHTRSVLSRRPWAVYPGNLQGRSIRTTEQGPKGALVVEVQGGRVDEPELVPLDVVRFVPVTIDIGSVSGIRQLVDRLRELADPRAHDGRSVIALGEITGSGPLHDELLPPVRRAELLDELRCSGEGDPFVWWDRLTWSTRPEVDLDDLRRGNDFLADLLATAEAAPADGDWRTPAAPLPADVARHLAALPSATDEQIAERALTLALEHLTGGSA